MDIPKYIESEAVFGFGRLAFVVGFAGAAQGKAPGGAELGLGTQLLHHGRRQLEICFSVRVLTSRVLWMKFVDGLSNSDIRPCFREGDRHCLSWG